MSSSKNDSATGPEKRRREAGTTPDVASRGGPAAFRARLLVLVFLLGLARTEGATPKANPTHPGKPKNVYRTFTGCCDASGAAPLNDALIATASDEDNILRLFRLGTGGAPISTVNVSTFVDSGRHQEADLEAAARLGPRIFWIGSHSRAADGRFRHARHVLFATAIQGAGDAARLFVEGQPYHDLVRALANEPSFAKFQFLVAAGIPAEQPGSLNIEGLSAGPDNTLLIGFRSPVPDGLALVVPLINPVEVIHGKPAVFGTAFRLNLGGLGIRDLARSGTHLYLIAGPADGGGRHRLFRFPDGGDAPEAVEELRGAIPKGFPAEGLILLGPPTSPVLWLLGDEGNEKIGPSHLLCQDQPDPTTRSFRARVWGSPTAPDP